MQIRIEHISNCIILFSLIHDKFSKAKVIMKIIILILSLFVANLMAYQDIISDSLSIKKTFTIRSKVGLALSIAGPCLEIPGIILPFTSNIDPDNAGPIFCSSLGMIFLGSTVSGIGCSVIKNWGRDHVKGLPENKTWLFYKIGSALMYSGFIWTAVTILQPNSNTVSTGPGPLIFVGGEAFMLISSIQSIIYCSRVKVNISRNKFQYFVYPTIRSNNSFGLAMNVTF